MDKRSPIWKYFEVCEDEKKAMCKLCKTVISRGSGGAKSFTTTPLNNHIAYKHPEEHKEIAKKKAAAASTSAPGIQQTGWSQQKLADVISKKKPWSIDSTDARKVHQAIGTMIAVDIQPYSIVEDVGFKALIGVLEPRYILPSRKFFTEKIIPEMYDAIRSRVQAAITKAQFICLTTDTWTAQTTTASFLSLTAHWIDDTFSRKSAVLHCEKFDGQHTGARLAAALLDMLRRWNIDKERIHLVLSDGGANMVKAMKDADLPHTSCFAHSLQLALNDAILSQSSVAELLTLSRKLVGHFRHSSSATSRLHTIQEELGVPNHQLHQDVVTRWNSTYQMLERLLEQKRAVAVYLAECDDKSSKALSMTKNQWGLAARIVAILQPFEQLTREISCDNACISVVLPAVQAILLYLEKDVCDEGIKKTVGELIASLTKRFAVFFDNALFTVSAGSDPRFKLSFLTTVQQVKSKTEIVTATLLSQPTSSASKSPPTSPAEHSESDTDEPPTKKTKTTFEDFWSSWDQLQPVRAEHNDISVTIETELNSFLSEPCVPRHIDPMQWWRTNMSRFPTLCCTAKRYLSAPPTSVPSERLFSTAGDTFSDTRSCLHADNMERLIFLKANVSLMG